MSLANHVYGQHLVGIQQLSFRFPSQEAANTFTEDINRYSTFHFYGVQGNPRSLCLEVTLGVSECAIKPKSAVFRDSRRFFTIQESAAASAPMIESNESEHENSK